MTEDEILRYVVQLRRGMEVPVYGIDLEIELGRLYMPRLAPDATNEQIYAWGAEFKSIALKKIAEKEKEMIAEGSLK